MTWQVREGRAACGGATWSSASDAYACAAPTCSAAVLATVAGGYTCEARMRWLQSSMGGLHAPRAACARVAGEFASECGACMPDDAYSEVATYKSEVIEITDWYVTPDDALRTAPTLPQQSHAPQTPVVLRALPQQSNAPPQPCVAEGLATAE
jgi:hypothetical protein